LPEASTDPWSLAYSRPSLDTEVLPEPVLLPVTPIAFEDVRNRTDRRSWIRLAIPRSVIPIAVAVIAVIAGMLLRSRQPVAPAVNQERANAAAGLNDTRNVDGVLSRDAVAAPANDNYSPSAPVYALPAAPSLSLGGAGAFRPADVINSTPVSTPPLSTAPSAGDPPTPTPVPKRLAKPTASEKGRLAISSPTATDIYSGDKFLGSTPITLDLPPGSHTFEYRHQGERKSVTHIVKAKETGTAMVTFEETVQINARPWAQVFIQGDQRRSLGQTPLSNVRVPIGSVLVFENPNFPGKNYRVTGNETAIQIVFP
jgi:hypothetical protein